jgi:HAMP domain-containing protein
LESAELGARPAPACSPLSVLFWLPLVRGITRSVGQLTRATEQIAEGQFETRVPTERRDELGKLGESVNRMASRLDAHMSGPEAFSSVTSPMSSAHRSRACRWRPEFSRRTLRKT